MHRKFKILFMVMMLVAAVFLSGCVDDNSAKESNPVSNNLAENTTQVITDMMGRTVELPSNVSTVVTVGPVPVINTFIEVMGESSTIANGLPESFVKQGRWKYQYVFAPQIEGAPVVQDSSGTVNIESLLQIDPDVVFTMDKSTVSMLEGKNINVVYLQWTNTTDVEQLMILMGDIYNNPQRAEEYNQYFESKISEVNEKVTSVPEEEQPKVLFCSPTTLTVPHKICEWWTTQAGGIAVSQNNRTSEVYTFDMEQLLKWDPDLIITQKPSDIDYIYNDTRFSDISAVKDQQVYTTPVGAHVWGHRGIETPLMVEWAASKLYPEKITYAEMFNDTASFYQQFFDMKLTEEQITEILNGTAGT